MDELTQRQAEELHGDLRALRAALTGEIANARSGAKPVDLDLPIGRVSRIDAIAQQQMARAGLEALEIRLRQVEAALALYEAGDYGYCRSCDEPVGFKRLKARPEAPLCLACQSRMEQRR